ncbi:MAG: hypothetical protein JWO19_2714 [Bryobacterales bacterium]|jgi:hypothetical protein|nr:hypothetical protein [Bryobacterales bacterium]
MEMVKATCFALALASCAWAADFSLAIGNPVAVALPNGIVKKDIGLAVRAESCADPAKAQLSGTAEGIENGVRRSVPLRVVPAATPGAYAVLHDWPPQGVWVLNLTGHCGSSTASAIVAIGTNGLFIRESSKFFPRAATAAEVESVLTNLRGAQ